MFASGPVEVKLRRGMAGYRCGRQAPAIRDPLDATSRAL